MNDRTETASVMGSTRDTGRAVVRKSADDDWAS